MTDRETHLSTEGLWVPMDLQDFTAHIVFRTPRSTIVHYQSGGGHIDGYYGMIDETHFGDLEEMRDPNNPGLAPDRVTIKPRGEEAVELTVEDI